LEQAAVAEKVLPKAVILHRFIAKLIDFLIVLLLSRLVSPVGFFMGITYLLAGDGFFHGKSVGKLLVGLQTYVPQKKKNGSFRESILRNFPLLLGYLALAWIPVIGWLLFAGVVGIEMLLMIGNEKGMRIGDELALTQVVDCEGLEVKNL